MRRATYCLFRSVLCRWLLCCAIGIVLLSCLALPFAFSLARPGASLATIRENGYFRADLGFFFVEDGRIDVYDGGLDSGIIWDNVLGKYELLRQAEKELPRSG